MNTTSHSSADFSWADPSATETENEWQRLLDACKQQLSVGFGLLDSFLSGPDLARRIALVENEANTNQWLRLELLDMLQLDQSNDMSPADLDRLRRVVGIERRDAPLTSAN